MDASNPATPATPPTSSTPAPRAVRQLRLVVSVPEGADFDQVLAFYRDVLGMPEQEAYEGEDDARVVILDAGRATLELSNPAQVRLIDRVETDGGTSAPLRVALEVDDSAATTRDAVAAGAELVASPRETPWRSLNARLEGPAGLQLTLFQELD
ncbi:VOC family protein [Agromyces sp. MMS24-JH15]|uniref:VOC family protein n=1 Tax=Agromyces sp. MMS24-JH15 TaxID=3243765 RepID=UPI00374875C3